MISSDSCLPFSPPYFLLFILGFSNHFKSAFPMTLSPLTTLLLPIHLRLSLHITITLPVCLHIHLRNILPCLHIYPPLYLQLNADLLHHIRPHHSPLFISIPLPIPQLPYFTKLLSCCISYQHLLQIMLSILFSMPIFVSLCS